MSEHGGTNENVIPIISLTKIKQIGIMGITSIRGTIPKSWACS